MPGRRPSRGAAAMAAALALALAPGPAGAVAPDALPESLWWRDRATTSLAREPLAAFDETRAFLLSAEWAPLYSGPDGARVEQARRFLRVASAPGPWRVAAEVLDQGGVARGGESAWWVGAEQPLTSSGTFALGRHGRALDLATSIDQRGGGEGLAADARVRPLPGLQISGGGSSLARTGTVYVRWEDVDVLATGRWKDRAAHAALEYRGARGFGAAIERRWTEPEPESRPAGAADAVAPWLRWRATSLRLTARGLGAAWSAGVEYGEGEQGLRAWRSGGRYLVITGPVSSTLLSLEVDPWRAPLRLRAFGGGWRGSAQGSLALWPFDALGAVSGSYRVAHSTASLDHWGLALERPDRPASRLDGGLALWSLSPRASYQSWQGTWLALVRSDQTAGATTLTSVLALGGRLGTRFTAAGVRCRLEAVQWVPVRSVREPEPGAASGGGGSGTVAGPGVHPRESGGTILRLSLEPGR